MSVNKSFKFLFWNAQSIANNSKQTQLQQTLDDEAIDIVLIAETYLNANHKCYFSNYILYRNDRDTHGGGVTIDVKKVSHIGFTNTSSIENISIQLTINVSDTIITAAYSPKCDSNFKSDMQKITTRHRNKKYKEFGDFNAKHLSWNCNCNNRAGIYNSFQSSNKQRSSYLQYANSHPPSSFQIDLIPNRFNAYKHILQHYRFLHTSTQLTIRSLRYHMHHRFERRYSS